MVSSGPGREDPDQEGIGFSFIVKQPGGIAGLHDLKIIEWIHSFMKQRSRRKGLYPEGIIFKIPDYRASGTSILNDFSPQQQDLCWV